MPYECPTERLEDELLLYDERLEEELPLYDERLEDELPTERPEL